MALDFTPQDIASGFQSQDSLDENFDNIQTALADGLSRSGSTPNAMGADLDMNSNRILNLPSATANGEPVTYAQWVASGTTVEFDGYLNEEQTATAGQTTFTTSNAYTPGLGALRVYINGVYQASSAYTETDANTVTFSEGLEVGDKVAFVISSFTSASSTGANNITYSPAGASAVDSNVQTKLREFVSVKDFGAVGDGVTDDTTAIQNAINSLGVLGGTVFLLSKRYSVSNITLKENVRLSGSGYSDQDEGNDYTYDTYSGSTLIVNGTVTLNDGAQLDNITMLSSAISGYSVPTTDGEADTLVASYSGTAITPSGTGCVIKDLKVLGFAYVTASPGVGNRHYYENIRFDCTNGITCGGGSDVTRIFRCHGWPYLTGELGLSSSVNYRSGIAFSIEGNSDRWAIFNCYEYGYETGYKISGSSGNLALYNKLIDCSADSGAIGSSGTSVGFYLSGYVGQSSIIGCQSTGYDTNFISNTVGANTGGGERLNVHTLLNCQFSLAASTFAQVANGYVSFLQCSFYSGSTSTICIDWDSQDGGIVAHCTFEEMYSSSGSGSIIAFASTAADNNVVRVHNYQHSGIHADNRFVDNKDVASHTVQDISGAGAVDIISEITHIVTTGANAYTLADGYNGQKKHIVMQSDGGAGTLTPSNLANGTTITFDDVGDSAFLLFTNSAWHFMGGTATLA